MRSELLCFSPLAAGLAHADQAPHPPTTCESGLRRILFSMRADSHG